MKDTLRLYGCAEVLHYVCTLPRDVKIVTNSSLVYADLIANTNRCVEFRANPKRKLLSPNTRYIVGDWFPHMRKPDVIVHMQQKRGFNPKAFPDYAGLLQYIEECVNPGVTIATRDPYLLETIGSLRNDIWVTANMSNLLAIPVLVNEQPKEEDYTEGVKWYVLHKRK